MTPRVWAAVLMRDRISSLIPDPDVSIVSTSNNCLLLFAASAGELPG